MYYVHVLFTCISSSVASRSVLIDYFIPVAMKRFYVILYMFDYVCQIP